MEENPETTILRRVMTEEEFSIRVNNLRQIIAEHREGEANTRVWLAVLLGIIIKIINEQKDPNSTLVELVKLMRVGVHERGES